MRLKVSPKVAIDKIDALVREGAAMLTWLDDNYDDLERQMDEEEKAKKRAEEERRRAIMNEPSTIPVRVGAMTIDMPNQRKWQEALKVPTLTLVRYSEIGADGMKELKAKFHTWRDKTAEGLKEVFADYTPLHSFLTAVGEYKSVPKDEIYEDYVNLRGALHAKVNTLIGFYNTLANYV